MDFLGLGQLARIRGGHHLGCGDGLAELLLLRAQLAELLRFSRRKSFAADQAHGLRRLGFIRKTVITARDGAPGLAVERCLDAILRCHAIGEARHRIAVAAPHDVIDALRACEFKLHPRVATLAGDPTVRIAVKPVIDVRELMNRMARQRARRARLRTARDVGALREDLEFINARLAAGGVFDAETHELRVHRIEAFRVRIAGRCDAQMRLRRGPRVFLQHDHVRRREALAHDAQQQLRLRAELMHAQVLEAAPQLATRHRASAVGELAMIRLTDLALVVLGVQVAVQIEQIARIFVMRAIAAAPRDPHAKLAHSLWHPGEHIVHVITLCPGPVAIGDRGQIARGADVIRLALGDALFILEALGDRGPQLLRVLSVVRLDHHGAQGGGLGLERRERGLDGLQFLAHLRGLRQLLGVVAGLDRTLAMHHAREHGSHAVVIGLRHGIELVIVAARALQREAQERGACGSDHVVEFIGALLRGEHGIRALHFIPWSAHDEAHCSVFTRLIAGDLIAHKGIERFVLVQRANDVVAVAPRVGSLDILFKPIRLREAHYIQPMPRPALAVAGGVEELVHQSFVSVRCCGLWRGRDVEKWRSGEVER